MLVTVGATVSIVVVTACVPMPTLLFPSITPAAFTVAMTVPSSALALESVNV